MTMPGVPGYGMPYGPYFDGRYTHNTTTSPSVNGMFEVTNATQAQFEQAAMFNNAAPPGYDPNLAFFYSMIQPGLVAANQAVYGQGPAAGHGIAAGHGESGHGGGGSSRSLGKTAKYAAIGAGLGWVIPGAGPLLGAGIGALVSLL